MGWGIHLHPGGVLYNVSGFQAVESTLKGGARLRIGTDEPGSVCRAIEGVIGVPAPLSPQERAQVRSSAKNWMIVTGGILVLVLGGIGLLIYLEEQPPRVAISKASMPTQRNFHPSGGADQKIEPGAAGGLPGVFKRGLAIDYS